MNDSEFKAFLSLLPYFWQIQGSNIMSITIIIIAITSIISYLGFQNRELIGKLMLYPIVMRSPLQAYRLITSGFVHSNTAHLIFNMVTLYFVGTILENMVLGTQQFVLLYLSGIVVASLPSYYKRMHDPEYAAVGASGGVAALIFAFIYVAPWQLIYLFFFLPIPAIVFAIAYLIYSYVMSKKRDQNIGHDAHFYGSVYGLLFMLVIDPSHGMSFIERLMRPGF